MFWSYTQHCSVVSSGLCSGMTLDGVWDHIWLMKIKPLSPSELLFVLSPDLSLFLKKSLRKLVYHKNLVSISFWNSVDTWEECWELSNGPNTQVPLFTPNNRPLGIMTIRSFTVTHDEELEPNLYIALKHHMVKMTDIMIAGKMFYWPSNRPFVTPTLHRHKFQ